MTEDDVGQWQHVFQELIQEVKPWHKWTFTPDKELLPDVLKPGWTQYQQKAFARFHCSSCSRSWASGRVLIVFHMRWCEKKAKGQVKMRVFAQRCNQCPEAPFAAPEFTWDNISRILNNLLFRILKKCYKEGFKQMGEIPLLGDTSLEGPHDSGNCEACLLGFCAQNDLGQASKPPAPPLSPTSSKSAREPKVTAACQDLPCSQSSSKVEKPQASDVSPHATNPSKEDPKVSRTSKPSTNPRLTIKQLSEVSSSAKPSTNPRLTIKQLSEVSSSAKPSTNPRLTIKQLSEVSSSALECVIQMPSPISSNRAADTAKNTRSKAPKASLSSSSCVPPTSSCVPPTSSTSSLYVTPTSSYVPPTSSTSSLYVPLTSSYVPPTSSSNVPPSSFLYPPPTPSYVPSTSSSCRPPANTACQVERSAPIHPESQSSCCKACCAGCGGCCGACCMGCEGCGGCFCEVLEGCCKVFLGCCKFGSESPQCCLFFLILFLLLWYLL